MYKRAFGVSLLSQCDAKIHVRYQILLLQSQSFLNDSHGIVEFGALRQRRTEIRVRASIFRIERDRFPEFGDRAAKISLLHDRNAQPVVRLCGRWPDFYGLLKGFEGVG